MNADRFNLISDYFKRRAQLLSFVVGIILAIMVNIHGIRLFERYLSDPELTATVIAQSDNIESAIASAQKRQAAKSGTEEENIIEIKAALNPYNELMGNFNDAAIEKMTAVSKPKTAGIKTTRRRKPKDVNQSKTPDD